MQNFFEWFGRTVSPDDPWLILGKGPSFALRDRYDLTGYRALALNHAVREGAVLVAHAIDLDVAATCAHAIDRNADVLVLPWVPHVHNLPGKRTLDELVPTLPILRELDAQGRLLWYNLSTTRTKRGGSAVVQARYFSAEAAISLLALAGAKTIRSLGVDGGAAYSGEFADLNDVTLLSNTHSTFDLQFKGIAETIMTTGTDYAPLNVESPIRVYVGSQEAQMLAVKVLEHSIRKNTSMSVEVFPLHHAKLEAPTPNDPANRPRTPFSFQRFLIPGLAGYEGRAMYVDSDMQVFDDLRKVWTLPFDGADLLAAREPGDSGRKPQFSVMLLDCGALRWDLENIVEALDRGELTYETLMYQMAVARNIEPAIDPRWNSLERYREGETGLLHYTDMTMQPWVSTKNPLGYLWMRDLFGAIDVGAVTREYVAEHVEQGWVRPSLLYQLDHRVEDPRRLPREGRAADKDYVAPWQKMGLSGGPADAGWKQPARVIRGALRRLRELSPL